MNIPAFDFEKNYLLQNDVALLRPLEEADSVHLSQFAEHETDIWQYSLMRIASPADLKEYIRLALEARGQQKEYPFVVFDKRTGAYAGSTRFYDIQLSNSTLQLGYTWYGKSFQQTGLNRHCKFLLLQFAFEQCGFERVEFRADARNERSIAAMKKIGCTVEGVLRSHMWLPDGTRRGSIVLSVLKDEWHTRVRNHLGGLLLR
ncbi:MAG: GNAT family N-acetyltransferase [Bacteroidetes bacterium]|nr:GNAT family N-acetyltransferase [Bacteroidota bacterium]